MSFGRRFALLVAFAISQSVQAQEIEARLYSNAPVDYNFLGVGFTQVTTSKFQINTEILAYNRTFDVFGQSGKFNVILPYAQLHGQTSVGNQVISGSSVGLTDPIIRLAANLYGAPALSVDEFKHYQQDLIIGANLSAVVPWGEYNSNQLFNVGANRTFLQPGLGVSKANGPWRYELSGDVTFFSDNKNFYGGNNLSEKPIYSLILYTSTSPERWKICATSVSSMPPAFAAMRLETHVTPKST